MVKWLGFHLTLNIHHQIRFDENEIQKRCNSIAKLRDQIFQYTNTISIKFRIYKIFIAPYIELYTPLIAQDFDGTGRKISCLHTLQHRSLCKALGLCQTTSRRELELKVGERSVEEKTRRMAIRIIAAMNLKPIMCDAKINRQNVGVLLYPNNKYDRQNLINRLFFYKALDIEDTKKAKFRLHQIKKWIAKVKRKQRRYILLHNQKKKLSTTNN